MNNKRIKTGVRLRDVATAAGVSSATVSAIVNGRAQQYGICQATQEKVQALIRQMGYSPSLAALDMAAGRNSLLGLAVSADFPAADRLMASLEPALAQSGFRLVVAYLPSDPQVASARITSLLQFGIAGLVVCPSESLVLPKITGPAVIVGRPGAGLPAVYEDEAEGGRRLARRLLEKGHRRLAILGAPGSTLSATSGFLEACAQGGATTRCFNSVAEFLPAVGSVTAVFCGSSSVLLELYSRGLSAGLRLGSSLAVVAVDRLGVAANLVPRPTVLKPGGTQLGQAGARLLQQAIEGSVPGDIRLDPVLVDGDSMPEISPDKAKPQSGISMEGGAPSPPAPKPANPVFDVPAAVSTGDTPVTTSASLPLPVVAAVPPPATLCLPATLRVAMQAGVALRAGGGTEPRSPGTANATYSVPEPAVTPSEALQTPETASDVLGAPNSSLPASPPISMEGGALSPPAPEPANPVFDVPAAVTTGDTDPRSPGTSNATYSVPEPAVTSSEALQMPESASDILDAPSSPLPASDPISMEGGALSPPAPEPANPVFDVPAAVTTGDTDPRSPGTANATYSVPEPAGTPSEALQIPETASDVLSAPSSPLSASAPISMEGGALSPPAPEPVNPVFDVPAAVSTGDTPVTTGASLPLAVEAGGTSGTEPRSPGTSTSGTPADKPNATFPEPDVTPSPAFDPEPVIPDPAPPAPLETPPEALQMPEPASDVLSAPSSPLPASPPDNSTTASPVIDVVAAVPGGTGPESASPVFDVPAAVTTGDTPVTTSALLPLAVVAAVLGGTEPESANPVTEPAVTQAFVSDGEINPRPNPLPSQGEGVSLPQDFAISPSEALQMPEAASDVPTEKVDSRACSGVAF